MLRFFSKSKASSNGSEDLRKVRIESALFLDQPGDSLFIVRQGLQFKAAVNGNGIGKSAILITTWREEHADLNGRECLLAEYDDVIDIGQQHAVDHVP